VFVSKEIIPRRLKSNTFLLFICKLPAYSSEGQEDTSLNRGIVTLIDMVCDLFPVKFRGLITA
ncbi:hypothetical protein, partial [Candidatus Bathycorpusculum sp.]|uniref:hypothetical protein n=1 Tax=Candidatus Bathycorpusculum sp. TaxID=2994959 RepID=UPI0028340075|nr:hypothetical protein [Candidatus Termitimicrobium sp.]MCL2684884.1 hypothetical protein [Candidatus Termitimicrobium sp.]